MMISDLIDEDDFRDRLVALGVDIPAGVTPLACAQAALAADAVSRVQGLRECVAELHARAHELQPEVRQAVETVLGPGLA